jgi:hypothetical protein
LLSTKHLPSVGVDQISSTIATSGGLSAFCMHIWGDFS